LNEWAANNEQSFLDDSGRDDHALTAISEHAASDPLAATNLRDLLFSDLRDSPGAESEANRVDTAG
jgi:hypothetical protein